jgi:hypothetical protein
LITSLLGVAALAANLHRLDLAALVVVVLAGSAPEQRCQLRLAPNTPLLLVGEDQKRVLRELPVVEEVVVILCSVPLPPQEAAAVLQTITELVLPLKQAVLAVAERMVPELHNRAQREILQTSRHLKVIEVEMLRLVAAAEAAVVPVRLGQMAAQMPELMAEQEPHQVFRVHQ